MKIVHFSMHDLICAQLHAHTPDTSHLLYYYSISSCIREEQKRNIHQLSLPHMSYSTQSNIDYTARCQMVRSMGDIQHLSQPVWSEQGRTLTSTCWTSLIDGRFPLITKSIKQTATWMLFQVKTVNLTFFPTITLISIIV